MWNRLFAFRRPDENYTVIFCKHSLTLLLNPWTNDQRPGRTSAQQKSLCLVEVWKRWCYWPALWITNMESSSSSIESRSTGDRSLDETSSLVLGRGPARLAIARYSTRATCRLTVFPADTALLFRWVQANSVQLLLTGRTKPHKSVPRVLLPIFDAAVGKSYFSHSRKIFLRYQGNRGKTTAIWPPPGERRLLDRFYKGKNQSYEVVFHFSKTTS